MAKVWNKQIFEHIKRECDEASIELAEERGACPDAQDVGVMERFTNKLAIAPTASISIICGNSSPGIEPYAANSFTQKTLTGSFTVRNKHLKKMLAAKGQDNDDVWSSISMNEGSVQHLEFFTQDEKDVFKTAQELDQRWLVEHAADRTNFICQAQSVNLFFPGDVQKKYLHEVHWNAWKKGVKSLYYCRSTSIQRAEKTHESEAGRKQLEMKLQPASSRKAGKQNPKATPKPNYEECLACQ